MDQEPTQPIPEGPPDGPEVANQPEQPASDAPVDGPEGRAPDGTAGSNGNGAGDHGNGDEQDRSLAGRLFSTGSRGAQRLADRSGLDQAIESAVEEAIVRAIESEATENAIARVINGPLIEQAVSEAIASESVETAIIEALDSEMADRIWDHMLEGPLAQQLVERVADAPEVRSAIASQGIGLIGDLGNQISKVTRVMDSIGERVSRRIFLRPKRLEPTSRAGFFTRVLALGIDALIVNFTLVALAALIRIFGEALGLWTSSPDSEAFAVGAFFWFLLSSAYLFIFWSLSGQTPGMQFLDIRIESHGERRIGPRAAFRRLLGFWASAAMLGLGFIGTLYRIDRRGLHDRLGGTVAYFIDPGDADAPHEKPEL
jgi:uncharacterized RDD family membrane protein YckC